MSTFFPCTEYNAPNRSLAVYTLHHTYPLACRMAHQSAADTELMVCLWRMGAPKQSL